jgi:phosphoribosylaminoimidazole-succinocarboxamide synthase
MTNPDVSSASFNHLIESTDLPFLGIKYQGKVRDNYSQDGRRVIIATDRLSCFDRVVTSVPYKGRVLSQLALWWFKQTDEIIANHLIANPHPNAVVVKDCKVLPVEVVVRSYLTGSAWRDYEAGRAISGIRLPAGMRPNQKLPELLLTPSTKAEVGTHDEPISEQEILDKNIVPAKVWQTMREAALKLFALGEKKCAENGLIFVDTKYEFGIFEDQVLLVDEIHTLDSSRFWVEESYKSKFEAGESPVMLDKEPVRQWLLQQGFKGDGPIPNFSDDYRLSLARHYLDSYKRITAETLSLKDDISLEQALREYAPK